MCKVGATSTQSRLARVSFDMREGSRRLAHQGTGMTKCKGSHHDLDDFTTYDLTTFTTSRLVIDLETGFTVQK
jgi:hypothetical protein